METFHPFPRLPLELRILIWEAAVVQDRMLKVRRLRHRTPYYSPTPVPGVTRACRESRKYCGYQRTFITDGSPRYIWVNFASDVLQMPSRAMKELVDADGVEKKETRHLRIEMVDGGWDESDTFFYDHGRQFGHFPGAASKLETVDILLTEELSHPWTNFIEENWWGACPKDKVRLIDAKTGEWIDSKTSGPYQDYLDTGGGKSRDYQRLVDYDCEWEESDGDERYEAMINLQIPLPRIDLDY